MAKYKIGDRVRLVSKKPNHPLFVADMEKYLGKTLTVRTVVEDNTCARYTFDEAYSPIHGLYWSFPEVWISGLAAHQVKQRNDNDLSVVIRFSGNKTTARLMRGETIVKTATARRNPADNYSRAEGARVAVERLFEKKKPMTDIEEKFVITRESIFHCFKRGQIVRLVHRDGCISRYKDEKGTLQYVPDSHVRPYKETSK